MSQLFDDDKRVVPVTIVHADPNVVLQVKTEQTDGYNAIKLGFEDVKPQRARNPDIGQAKAADTAPKRFMREVRFDDAPADEFGVGETVTVSIFDKGSKVDVQGTSKGRGFSGVMRRFNFAGQVATHGTHEFFRHGGAIGMNMTPGRVHKGTAMPGQMGNKTVSVQNLTVVRIDEEQNLLYIKGAVPGPRNALVYVKQAVKKG